MARLLQTKWLAAVRNDHGFTLLEAMIVVAVITIMLTFSLITFQTFSEMMQRKTFIGQLKTDLYYLHSLAINQQKSIVFQFSVRNNQYEARFKDDNETSKDEIFKRKLPQQIKIEKSNLPSFVITPDGNVSNFGTVHFRQQEKTFKITFYIGRGRFYVEE